MERIFCYLHIISCLGLMTHVNLYHCSTPLAVQCSSMNLQLLHLNIVTSGEPILKLINQTVVRECMFQIILPFPHQVMTKWNTWVKWMEILHDHGILCCIPNHFSDRYWKQRCVLFSGQSGQFSECVMTTQPVLTQYILYIYSHLQSQMPTSSMTLLQGVVF